MGKILQALFETLVVTLLYIAIGYYFFPDDPLILESKAPFIAILLTIITLFHGAKYGLVSLFLLNIILYLSYQPYPINQLLANLLLVLVLGQFYHYWFKKIESIEAASLYIKERLNDANHAFYALKISHDTLEKSYVVKPVSLRSSFKELETLHFKDGSHFQHFLQLLEKSYNIEGASIALLHKGTYNTVASSNNKQTKLNLNDPLVRSALQSAQTSYISQEEHKSSLYLSVIPITNHEDTIIALLTINKMPFMEFNENTIIAITILFSYFLDQVKLQEHLKKYGTNSINADQIFTYHYDKLFSLKNSYDIDSSTIIIKAENELVLKMLKKIISTSLRSLDRYQVLKEQKNTILLLLPLTPTVIAETIIKKLQAELGSSKFEYMVFEINQKTHMRQYIEGR